MLTSGPSSVSHSFTSNMHVDSVRVAQRPLLGLARLHLERLASPAPSLLAAKLGPGGRVELRVQRVARLQVPWARRRLLERPRRDEAPAEQAAEARRRAAEGRKVDIHGGARRRESARSTARSTSRM